MEVEEHSCQDELAMQQFMAELISTSAAASYLPLLADLTLDPDMNTSVKVRTPTCRVGAQHYFHNALL